MDGAPPSSKAAIAAELDAWRRAMLRTFTIACRVMTPNESAHEIQATNSAMQQILRLEAREQSNAGG